MSMPFGNIQGLVNGTEQVIFDHEITAAEGAQSSLSTGNILNGDEDGWYTIIIRHISAATDDFCLLRLNNDSETNYGYRGIQAINTTVNNVSNTGRTYLFNASGSSSSGESTFSIIRLYAKSGSVRLCNTTAVSKINGTTVDQISTLGQVWKNSADNITNITFLSIVGNGLGVGTRILILKSNNFTNGTPTGEITSPYIRNAWVRLPGSGVLVSDASNVTFTGLDGDRDVAYAFSACVKLGNSGAQAYMQFNDDTGNNYGLQRMTGVNTTTGAARITAYPTFRVGNDTTSTNQYEIFNGILFSKKGYLRPGLICEASAISSTTVGGIMTAGAVWNNTADVLSKIKVAASAGNFLAGSLIDLYALRPNG